MVTMSDYEYADLIDDQDKVRLLVDPTSTYARAAAAAMGRAMDDVIISAALGTSLTGKDGTTSTPFDSNNTIAVGGAGLTLSKLIEAKEILDSNDVDPSIPRYMAVSPKQIANLLDDNEITSADYNTVRALVKGELDTFVGFKFIMTNRLGVDGSGDRRCFAWAMDGLKLAVGKEPTARIDERADKSYATQVYYCMSIGATRMEEAKVVEIICDE